MYSPCANDKALLRAEQAPQFSCATTFTDLDANCRAMRSVSSLDPSSTTMISLCAHVWSRADWIVERIQRSALYDGMRIETKAIRVLRKATTTVGVPTLPSVMQPVCLT